MNNSSPKFLFQVFDFDNGSEDDFLGRTSIPVTSIMDNTDIFDRQVVVQERTVRTEPRYWCYCDDGKTCLCVLQQPCGLCSYPRKSLDYGGGGEAYLQTATPLFPTNIGRIIDLFPLLTPV